MIFAHLVYGLVAFAYGGLAVGLFMARAVRGARIIVCAAGLTALWAAMVLLDPRLQDAGWFAQATGWIGAIMALDARFAGTANPGQRRAEAALAGFGLVCTVLAGFAALAGYASLSPYLIEGRLIFALATVILIENVYRNASEDTRWHINLPLIAIAAMAVFTMLLYGDAIIHKRLSPTLFEAQGIVYLMVTPLLIATERRLRRWRTRLALSHGAAFYTTSLILGGSFLVGLGIAGAMFRRGGKDWGSVVEIALIFAGFVLIAVLASSGSARSRLRRLIVENFFAHRYDYRHEWLRCIDTLAAIEEGGLPQRVIKVLADTVDSPSGVLMLRDEAADQFILRGAGEWNMRSPLTPFDESHPLLGQLAREGHCIPGDDLPIGTVPACWLAVALPDPRSSKPLGVVLLGAPRAPAALDGESIALLRVVAREISLMLAERRAAEALAEARRFAAAGQRFAFVAHDIKNVANQLALLVSNADHHMNDPAFRDDMMATLRGSVGKIQSMLTRLKTPEAVPYSRIDVIDRLRAITTSAVHKARIGVVLDIDGAGGDIGMEQAAFDAVINHLIENAVEASAPGQIVSVGVRDAGGMIEITITDRGTGMSEAFIRDQLFRPFVTSKPAGFGLGAFQARELVHAAGGTLAIASVLGEGTVVRLAFPALAPAAQDAKLLVA